MPDKIADIVKIKVEDKSSYRCVICGNIYPRRFNAERHYKRFHETTQARRCCGKEICIIYYVCRTQQKIIKCVKSIFSQLHIKVGIMCVCVIFGYSRDLYMSYICMFRNNYRLPKYNGVSIEKLCKIKKYNILF